MEIKKDLTVSTSEPWYDLSGGGCLNPDEICEKPEDAQKVKEAVKVVQDFFESCAEQIEGFIN